MTDSGSRQRLAAILAADVVGYSRLMTADEHVTMAALDAARLIFRTQIESSQGRVIDMAGDSVLAVFDSATGADACLWHPWLRINRVLRTMLHTRWSEEAWAQVRVEFTKALALRSQIRRAGWFN